MLTINNTLDGYLKDVEILGNTIQNEEDLADIRSVGEKVEGQELYEIPVLSVSENVFNNKWELGGISSTGEDVNSTTIKRTDFIKIGGSNVITPCMPKYVKSNGSRYITIIFYDKNKKYLGVHYMGDNYIRNSFVPPVGSEYVRFTMSTTITECEFEVFLDNRSFVSQGNLIESTPYQEDKITILSPVQLEKVGDVADRIIEKDGVWGVEKWIKDYTFDTSLFKHTYEMTNTIQYYTDDILTDAFRGISTLNNINSYCPTIKRDDRETSEQVECWSVQFIAFTMPKSLYSNINEFKASLPSTIDFKYVLAEPQFIPLPHSQQVKLRTFANKTNISFLTEIEGTIKAQVPKSLGATVNTHTEQINNLNKELDRVKKLEESTVSTVETESDFTTVEATSNGYFEDVKLEGKTLVNHIDFATRFSFNNFAISGGVVTLTNNGSWGTVRLPIPATLKTNTKYTIILNVLENTTGAKFYYLDNSASTSAFKSSVYLGTDSKGIITRLVETVDDFSGRNIGMRTDSDAGYVKFTYMLLEGDHTQNPPSYFEGLKSVGDGVDEVSVESVNKLGYRKNIAIAGTSPYGIANNGVSYILEDIEIGNLVVNNFKNSERMIVATYDSLEAGTPAIERFDLPKTIGKQVVKINQKAKFAVLYLSPSYNETTNGYIYQKQDKKRLLYYNNETQAWEKPILREWDSIEKHANGKYYYHQRSGEVVLNGSEEWKRGGWTNDSRLELYGIDLGLSCVQDLGMCDKLKVMPWSNSISSDYIDCVVIGNNSMSVYISSSKLASNDLAGAKQWLQTNNVTVVYQLAQEKVYECTNIDLITYANETNYIVESGVLSPKTTLKVHNNISNVVRLLQKKVSILESNITSYMITQNRLQLSSTHSADSVTFKVDYTVCSENMSQENYDTDLYNLILNNILVGKDNYDYDHMFNIIMDYASWSQISWDQFDILVGIMDIQHNPPIEEMPTDDEIVEEMPTEIM